MHSDNQVLALSALGSIPGLFDEPLQRSHRHLRGEREADVGHRSFTRTRAQFVGLRAGGMVECGMWDICAVMDG